MKIFKVMMLASIAAGTAFVATGCGENAENKDAAKPEAKAEAAKSAATSAAVPTKVPAVNNDIALEVESYLISNKEAKSKTLTKEEKDGYDLGENAVKAYKKKFGNDSLKDWVFGFAARVSKKYAYVTGYAKKNGKYDRVVIHMLKTGKDWTFVKEARETSPDNELVLKYADEDED